MTPTVNRAKNSVRKASKPARTRISDCRVGLLCGCCDDVKRARCVDLRYNGEPTKHNTSSVIIKKIGRAVIAIQVVKVSGAGLVFMR